MRIYYNIVKSIILLQRERQHTHTHTHIIARSCLRTARRRKAEQICTDFFALNTNDHVAPGHAQLLTERFANATYTQPNVFVTIMTSIKKNIAHVQAVLKLLLVS